MGIIEEKVKKRVKRKNIQKIVLGTVAAAGLLSVAMLAPNIISALGKLGIINSKRGYRYNGTINRARNRLIENGLLTKNNKGFLCLTTKGETTLRQLALTDFKLKKPKHWDKKWRVLIFDIPEKHPGLREKIRRTLVAIGFTHLQNSVWGYPYNCEDLIALLKSDFKVGKDLIYIVAEEIEYEKVLLKNFRLTKY